MTGILMPLCCVSVLDLNTSNTHYILMCVERWPTYCMPFKSKACLFFEVYNQDIASQMIASYVLILYKGKRVYIMRSQPTIHAYPRPLHIIHIITCPTHFPTETSKPLKSHKFCAIQRSSDHTTRECHFILYGPWQNVCGKLLPCLGIQFYCFAPLLKVILDGRGIQLKLFLFTTHQDIPHHQNILHLRATAELHGQASCMESETK